MPYKVISLGGSIIIPKDGFDIQFLKKFKKMILAEIKKGQKFIFVVGGGTTARNYQNALKSVEKIDNNELDWMGIAGTRINAEFVRILFGDLAYKEVLNNPTKKIKNNKQIIIFSGWKPGWSTDYVSVLAAETFGAKEVINASNIDYVYTADPKKDSDAKPLKKITWAEMKKIVGDKWNPGANIPFDPIATKKAQKLGLKVFFVKGTELNKFKQVINGVEKVGTIIQ